MLEEVDRAKLEDVLARLPKDSMHGYLLNTSVVLHTVTILVDIFAQLQVGHKDAKLAFHCLLESVGLRSNLFCGLSDGICCILSCFHTGTTCVS